MCFPKGMGGLGFRDLRRFNVALLGRQNVGRGDKIDIWRDNWGFNNLSGASIKLSRKEVHEEKVSDLQNIEKDGWNVRRVLAIYGEDLGDQIYKIPIIHNGPNDDRILYHNSLGYYLTKSAYSWLTLKHVGLGPHRFIWKLAWKLQTLPKIKAFCWRVGHNILPTYENISSIRREQSSNCPRCGLARENLLHAMRDCPSAKAVLVHGGLNNNLLEGSYGRCVDWLEDVARTLDLKAFSDFITVLWNIWNSRNTKVFQDVEEEARVTWERAAVLNRDFRIFNFMDKPLLPKPIMEKGWKKPDQGVVKIYFDASPNDRKLRFRLVARDHDGFVLGGRARMVAQNVQAEWAEFHVLVESFKFARSRNWLKLEIETDCASLVNRLNRRWVDLSTMGYSIRENIKILDFCDSYIFVWAQRSCNKAADSLCKWAKALNCIKDFDMDHPVEIHNVILSDAIN
ncbi:hypothetical protein PVK06_027156 [Gossypium arboreum]|uniref:Reverse transcriptase n=1 Tax=Gossypium arboreum TaxID=29729 RepID=A0ABR0P0V4_GOSAR|nr:hypothetical protein PVK06_027156 [Gossypium arboreum]